MADYERKVTGASLYILMVMFAISVAMATVSLSLSLAAFALYGGFHI